MAQAFTTIYAKDYKWKEQFKTKLAIPKDKYAETIPPSEHWLTRKEIHEEFEGEGLKEAEQIVRRLYNKRYSSVYQSDYCRSHQKKGKRESNNDIPTIEDSKHFRGNEGYDFSKRRNAISEFCQEDKSDDYEIIDPDKELLEFYRKLYTFPREAKILPPLPSSRKIFGYMRPGRMYTPLTSYQHDIGQLAYDILRGMHPHRIPSKDENGGKGLARGSGSESNNTVAKKQEDHKKLRERASLRRKKPHELIESEESGGLSDSDGERPSEKNKAKCWTRCKNTTSMTYKPKNKLLATSYGLNVYKYWDDDKNKMICTCS